MNILEIDEYLLSWKHCDSFRTNSSLLSLPKQLQEPHIQAAEETVQWGKGLKCREQGTGAFKGQDQA